MLKELPKKNLIGILVSFSATVFMLIMTGYGIYTGKLLVFGFRPSGFKDYISSSGNQISWYLVILLNLSLTFLMGYITFRLYQHEVIKIKSRKRQKRRN